MAFELVPTKLMHEHVSYMKQFNAKVSIRRGIALETQFEFNESSN